MSIRISEDAAVVAEQLHSAAIHLLRKLRRQDMASGLSAPRLSALSVVVFAGPVTLGDLAAAEQVRPPTMTRIVSALTKQGLVEKRKNERDGRIRLIGATPTGKKLLIEGKERRVRVLAESIGGLDAEDRATLKRAVEILREISGG